MTKLMTNLEEYQQQVDDPIFEVTKQIDCIGLMMFSTPWSTTRQPYRVLLVWILLSRPLGCRVFHLQTSC